MYSTNNIIRNFKKSKTATDLDFDDERKIIKDKTTGEDIMSYDKLAESFRFEMGASFNLICYIHGTLEHVIECKRCGTVIFTREDEDYDPRLRCPTCTDYNTHFSFYTKEEIEKDENKKLTVDSYKNIQREMDLDYEFEKKRGKPNNEITSFKLFNTMIKVECYNCRHSYFKGLHLSLWDIKKDEEGEIEAIIWRKNIPLTPKGIYYMITYNKEKKNVEG